MPKILRAPIAGLLAFTLANVVGRRAISSSVIASIAWWNASRSDSPISWPRRRMRC